MSAIESALNVLHKNLKLRGRPSLTNVDLHVMVSKATGLSRATLHGTLDGVGKGKLWSQPAYANNYHKQTVNGRSVHFLGASKLQEMIFTCPEKIKTNQRIMSVLADVSEPSVVTLASSEGNCVQAALAVAPYAEFTNVEMYAPVLDQWQDQKLSLGVITDDYLGTLEKFLQSDDYLDREWTLVNADVMGYPGSNMARWLTDFNESARARFLALTTQHASNGNFRNKNAAEWKSLYPSKTGPTDFMKDHLPAYKLVDRWTYRKEHGRQEMEVCIFERLT
jgi:hypothetical protein